jgi:hypothetical protein
MQTAVCCLPAGGGRNWAANVFGGRPIVAGVPWWRCVCLLLLLPGLLRAQDETRDRRHRQLLERRAAILDSLGRDLTALEGWCREQGMSDAGQELQELGQSLLAETESPELPRLVVPSVADGLTANEHVWRQRLQKLREERAGEIYTLARSALRAGFPSLAFAMIADVVRLNPDHKFARSVLGQELFSDPARRDDRGYAGEWVSPFEKQMRSGAKPQVWHPQYGWIVAASVNRYENGQRPWKGDWISSEKESELRRDFRNAWEIPSEHFLVRTNVSLEEGVQLSTKLEIFHAWLQQNFAAFFDTPKSLQERFEKAGRPAASRKTRPLEVHYYATRDEYQKRVSGKVPANIETNGLYWQPDRTCYFYRNPVKLDLSTLFHEATHQILDVATADARRVAARARAVKLRQRQAEEWVLCQNANFWLIEGLACYFESFEADDGGNVTLGDPGYVRFETAWQRLLDPAYQFYLPAQQFFGLGKDEFQSHPQISPLYTQAAGYAHFLMHYEDGLYRDDLIELLAQVYRPDADQLLTEPSFSRIAGVGWTQVDQQYREHMRNLEALSRARGE